MKTLATVALAILLPVSVFADSGSIPYDFDAVIVEPNQRAIIAWNGTEEILVLSTDLGASKPTKVLEVIPLPSEPEVKKGDMESFEVAAEIISERLNLRKRHGGGGFGFGGVATTEAAEPAGEVTFEAKIGAHDVTVVRVIEPRRFVEWVMDYLKKQDVEAPKIPEPLQEVVNEYIEDGFNWFVFNVVELGKEVRTKEAIQYKFTTSRLYYPMRITRAESGDTEVELTVLTPNLLEKCEGIPRDQIELKCKPIAISRRDLRAISNEMAGLLDTRFGVMLRIWKIKGELSSFEKDVLAW